MKLNSGCLSEEEVQEAIERYKSEKERTKQKERNNKFVKPYDLWYAAEVRVTQMKL